MFFIIPVTLLVIIPRVAKVAIKGTSFMVHSALMWVVVEIGMDILTVAKDMVRMRVRVTVRKSNIQILVQVAGK